MAKVVSAFVGIVQPPRLVLSIESRDEVRLGQPHPIVLLRRALRREVCPSAAKGPTLGPSEARRVSGDRRRSSLPISA